MNEETLEMRRQILRAISTKSGFALLKALFEHACHAFGPFSAAARIRGVSVGSTYSIFRPMSIRPQVRRLGISRPFHQPATVL